MKICLMIVLLMTCSVSFSRFETEVNDDSNGEVVSSLDTEAVTSFKQEEVHLPDQEQIAFGFTNCRPGETNVGGMVCLRFPRAGQPTLLSYIRKQRAKAKATKPKN